MKLRYARHTNNLDRLVDFYLNVVGLSHLGEFKNHDDYDGVFLGLPDFDWHLEFTQSAYKAEHYPDRDDLLVFYLRSDVELQEILIRARRFGVSPVVSKNPYWNEHGVELTDPDGFGLVLSIRHT